MRIFTLLCLLGLPALVSCTVEESTSQAAPAEAPAAKSVSFKIDGMT